jgi:hypothetical protein
VSEFAFNSPPSSAGWLAIKAFRTATRLLINDFFWIDISCHPFLVFRIGNLNPWMILTIAEATTSS